MTYIMVIYDIRDDKCRNQVADICLDYGLDREQYSIFIGTLKNRQIRALAREVEKLITTDSYVLVIPMTADAWEKRVQMGAPLHVN